MKILIYSPQFLPKIGGLEYVVNAWATQWTNMGQVVTVITQQPDNSPAKFNYRVLRNPGFWETARQMKLHDVVIMFNVSLKAVPQWVLSRRPLIISHHSSLFIKGNWKQNIFQWLKKQVAEKFAIENIACSAYTASAYDHCKVVHSPYKSHLFKNFRYPVRKGEILFAGRLVSDKGCDLLVKAAEVLKKKNKPVPSFTIIGDGPEKSNLVELAIKSGVDRYFNFKGFLNSDQIVNELNDHNIMVVPSRMEPFGIVALEGLATGCKMVLAQTGGLPEAGGRYASYFTSDDAGSLADVLCEVVDGNSCDADESAQDYLAEFTEEATAKKALDIILNAMTAK